MRLDLGSLVPLASIVALSTVGCPGRPPQDAEPSDADAAAEADVPADADHADDADATALDGDQDLDADRDLDLDRDAEAEPPCLEVLFEDDFEGTDLDPARWTRGYPGEGNPAWSSQPEDTVVSGGLLRVRGRGTWTGDSNSAVSFLGYMSTRDTFALPVPSGTADGVLVEARLRATVNESGGDAGPGWWPQWWWIDANPETYFEVDIIESFGNSAEMHPHLHVSVGGVRQSFGRWSANASEYGWPAPVRSGVTVEEVGAASPWWADFHTFAVARGLEPETGDEFVEWYYDGVRIFRLSPIPGDAAARADASGYLLLGQGKTTPETAAWQERTWDISAETDFPSYIEVDYVRVFRGPTDCVRDRAARP